VFVAIVKRKKKQSPPVRLSEHFYRRMNAQARLNSRSIAKHLEHMVSIAERVSGQVDLEDLLDIQSGLSRLVVEKSQVPRVDKQSMLDSVEAIRETEVLSRAVTSADVRYQASPFYPGYLERINEDGSREVGLFEGGRFKVAKDME